MNRDLKGIIIYSSQQNDLIHELNIYMDKRFKELDIKTFVINDINDLLSSNNRDFLMIMNALVENIDGIKTTFCPQNCDKLLSDTIIKQLLAENNTMSITVTSCNDFQNSQYDNLICAIKLEYGNNIKQDKKIFLNYAEAVIRAIAIYYGIPYVEPQDLKPHTYVVKEGDSLYSIAWKFNTTIKAIQVLNNISSLVINPGEILQIPNYVPKINPDEVILHRVIKGDSLYRIAQKYGVLIEDIIDYNQLNNSVIYLNQQLFIPITNNNLNNYIIKKGDTLYNIAKRYNINAKELMNYNNLTSNLLNIGQELLIPKPTNNSLYYVQENDSLPNIAEKFKVNMNVLMNANDLNTSDLKVGQILIIPNNK